MSKNLYPDGDFIFVDGGGIAYDERSKAYWPALLRLEIPRPGALRNLQSILTQALDPEFVHENQPIRLTFSGSIQRIDKEGDPISIDGGELQKLKDALSFYANADNWNYSEGGVFLMEGAFDGPTVIEGDQGHVARVALGIKEDDE